MTWIEGITGRCYRGPIIITYTMLVVPSNNYNCGIRYPKTLSIKASILPLIPKIPAMACARIVRFRDLMPPVMLGGFTLYIATPNRNPYTMQNLCQHINCNKGHHDDHVDSDRHSDHDHQDTTSKQPQDYQ